MPKRKQLPNTLSVRRGVDARLRFRPSLENLEARQLMAVIPYGAQPADTGEFFLGKVAVTPVFLESNGTIDPNIENWNASTINQSLNNLREGLNWWSDLLETKTTVHTLAFSIDETYAINPVPTAYEPITRVSNDYVLWVSEFLNRVGFNQSTSLDENMRAFNHSQRLKANADWAFTVFVVDSRIDQDGTFAPGGSFSRAFAFAGGLYFVVPSTRPASTYAHETGHMFWARDEYAGGGNYFQKRGYYNTQNLNAIDLQPNSGFQQAISIMSAGNILQSAYDQLVSPPSTLAMVGWQDSDNDGIFDVLDVPLWLDGVGRWNPETNLYRFRGTARADTLPNLNSSGLQSDITLNRISRVEYRLNQGPWTTVASPDRYEAELDLSIPLPQGSTGTIEIRAVDFKTGLTSNLFRGEMGVLPNSTTLVGINGFVWSDNDGDSQWDSQETARAGFTVRLIDSNGQPLSLQNRIEPDDRGSGAITAGAYSGVRLTTLGQDADGTLGVFEDTRATTGTKVFRPNSFSSRTFVNAWRGDRHQLRADFTNATSSVSVDVVGADRASAGRLEIYNAAGELLDRVTTPDLDAGESHQLELVRSQNDIAYAIIKGHRSTAVVIDNLRIGPKTQTETDSQGRYHFRGIAPGNYRLEVGLPNNGYAPSFPSNGIQTVGLSVGEAESNIDFGIQFLGSPWNNDRLVFDADNNGEVTPLDALLIINQLNLRGGSFALDGSGLTTLPFVDVSNDRELTPLDALLVINYLNSNGLAGGEGNSTKSPGGNSGMTSPPPDGEFSIDAVWDRYEEEVGPLLTSREFQERLTLPMWRASAPCPCPYCSSFG